jgi:hypothetical protein
MSKNITLKGIIVQHEWNDNVLICDFQDSANYESNPYTIFHREFEITIPESSLRFNPKNKQLVNEIINAQKIKDLELKKAQKCAEINQIEEEIQSLASISYKV